MIKHLYDETNLFYATPLTAKDFKNVQFYRSLEKQITDDVMRDKGIITTSKKLFIYEYSFVLVGSSLEGGGWSVGTQY